MLTKVHLFDNRRLLIMLLQDEVLGVEEKLMTKAGFHEKALKTILENIHSLHSIEDLKIMFSVF